MSGVSTAVGLALVMGALAGPAGAQELAFPYGKAGGWTVEAVRDAEGFTGCNGWIEQAPGRLTLSQRGDAWSVTVPGPRSQGFRGGVIRLDMGDRIDVQYGFGPGMTATAELTGALVTRIAEAASLRTRINNVEPVDWSLTGSRAAIELVSECVARTGKLPD